MSSDNDWSLRDALSSKYSEEKEKTLDDQREGMLYKITETYCCTCAVRRPQDRRECAIALTMYKPCQYRTDLDFWKKENDEGRPTPLVKGHIPCTVTDVHCLCTYQIRDHLEKVHGVDFGGSQVWYCTWGRCSHGFGGWCDYSTMNPMDMCQHILSAHIPRFPEGLGCILPQ